MMSAPHSGQELPDCAGIYIFLVRVSHAMATQTDGSHHFPCRHCILLERCNKNDNHLHFAGSVRSLLVSAALAGSNRARGMVWRSGQVAQLAHLAADTHIKVVLYLYL